MVDELRNDGSVCLIGKLELELVLSTTVRNQHDLMNIIIISKTVKLTPYQQLFNLLLSGLE